MLTVHRLMAALVEGIKDDAWAGTDIVLVSSDPEGNGYVAFEEPLPFASTRIARQVGGRFQETSDDSGTPALLLWPSYEIDTEV